MESNKLLRRLLIAASMGILLLVVIVIQTTGTTQDKKIAVGFIMSGGMQEEGWNGLHYQGIKKACEELGAELLVKENIKENTGECETAIRELAGQKPDVIIMSSYGYVNEVKEIVQSYPDITFYSESFECKDTNIRSYFARVYQARYQAGIVAGMQTKSNRIGYVAAMENCEVNRGINAFTLGVKKVNPKATVYVAWSGSWDNEEREKELAEQLIDEKKADVLTYHQNRPNVIEVAEKRKIASIGYHEPVRDASPYYLTAVEVNWDLVYKELILDSMKGKSGTTTTYWLGMDKAVIGLSEFSSMVSEKAKEKVREAETDMLRGRDVFSGKIYDNLGNLRSDEGENISDTALLTAFDWFVEGVEFYEGKR